MSPRARASAMSDCDVDGGVAMGAHVQLAVQRRPAPQPAAPSHCSFVSTAPLPQLGGGGGNVVVVVVPPGVVVDVVVGTGRKRVVVLIPPSVVVVVGAARSAVNTTFFAFFARNLPLMEAHAGARSLPVSFILTADPHVSHRAPTVVALRF